MSFRQIAPAKSLLIAIAILFSLLIISYIYVSEVFIPGQIRSLIEEISQEKGYKIEIKGIEFDFLTGLRGSEIEISDPVSLVKPILKVGEIAVKPEILPSFFNWKVKVGIIIDRPVFSLTEELDSLKNLFVKKNEGGDEKPLSVEISHLEIRDARIEIRPGVFLSSRKMEIDFEDAELAEKKTLRLSGYINLEGNEMEVRGRINPFLDAPTGELKINLLELDTSSFLPDNAPPVKLAISSDIKFRVSDEITSHGVINFASYQNDRGQEPELSGKLEYDLTYEELTDTVFFESVDFSIDDLIRSSFAGSIGEVSKEGIFKFVGKTEDIKIEDFPRRFSILSNLRFSGAAKINNIMLAGSKANKNIALSGDVLLDRVGIGHKSRGLQIDGIDGRIHLRNTFPGRADEGFYAEGSFSLKNASTKIGEFKEVEGKVEFISDNGWKNKRLNFSSLNVAFLDGVVSGDAEFKVLNGKNFASGDLEASNLNLEKIPENLLFANFGGKLERASAKFVSEDMKEFNTAISFSVRDFKIETERHGNIELSRVVSIEPLRIKYFIESQNDEPVNAPPLDKGNEGGSKTLEHGHSRIMIESKGLSYQNLSYNGFSIVKGNMSELIFKRYVSGDWEMDISSTGSEFRIYDKEVHLEEFQLDIDADNNEELIISGGLKGEGGRYGQISFPSLSTNFNSKNNVLLLTDVRSQVGSYGDLSAEELGIVFGEGENVTPYIIRFTQGEFSGLSGKIRSKGIEGALFIQTTENKKTSWNGDIYIQETNIFSQPLKNLSVRIESSPDGVAVDRISGILSGGDLKGKIFIKTSRASPFISSQIELKNPVFYFEGYRLLLGDLNVSFDGSIENSSLPDGKGEISFNKLNIGKDRAFSVLRGEVQMEAVDETIFIKQGFIENEEGSRINLSAGVENILNEARRLWVEVPQIPMVFIQETMSPLLPQFLSEGRFQGIVGLSLIYDRFLDEGGSLRGKLSMEDISFGGWLNGTDFFVKEVNGVIQIKDKSNSSASLPSLIRDYKEKGDERLLDEKVFNGFLDILKGPSLSYDESSLRIKEIVYGFLRFEDIECEIELTSEAINLKRLESGLYEGRAFGTGRFDFGDKDNKYDLSLLFKNISLAGISNSIPSAKDYISGKTNGIVWVSGEGEKLKTLDGLFNFWTIKSKDEPRRIAKALLQQLGVKERFFLKESRKYDKGEVSGYIKDGVITFVTLEISHTMFFLQDLSIKVDEKRNSISVAHFLSVIRETAKRASKGELKIEYGK